MKVLVTGATGYIGGAVADALHAAGHAVHGLAHSDEAAAKIRSRGWSEVRGDLRDTASLERAAGSVDAVVHAANTGGSDAAAVDTGAVRALLAELRGSGRAFLYTSGAWVLGAGSGDEESARNPTPLVAWRAPLEEEVIGSAPGVRALVIRPGIVYGRGGGIPGMVARGQLPLIGNGRQRWPLVHADDLADLYVRALDGTPGSILHGVASTLSMRDIALLGAAGGHQPAPAPVTIAEARVQLGEFADALALDQQVSARATRARTGWQPRAPSLVEELLSERIGEGATPAPRRPRERAQLAMIAVVLLAVQSGAVRAQDDLPAADTPAWTAPVLAHWDTTIRGRQR
jgi:nucleoside-diphosphate-sugar epimerase